MLKKRIIPLFLSIFLLVGTLAVPASAEGLTVELTAQETPVAENEWGSDYENQNSFEISSVADLTAFATMVNKGKDFNQKTVTLKSNLDLSSVMNWTPIGSVDLFSEDSPDEGDCPFAGTFNGGNYKISNLTISYGIEESDPLYDYGGLFGYVTGKVENVTLENVNLKAASNYMGGIAGALGVGATIESCSVSGTISGAEFGDEAYGSYVGGIVGYSEGTITNCTSSCTIQETLYQVGGIAGGTDNGTITNCENTGSIEGLGMTGGIVGEADDSTITNCSNSGTVTGKQNTGDTRDNRRIGGIVGYTLTTTVEGCLNTGAVTAEGLTEVGGIVGYLYYGSTVEDCSNAGVVTGGDSTGGVVGFASAYSTKGYEITNCTNTGSVDGDSGVGGIVGVSTANNNESSTQVISGCTNSGVVSGESDVGGIVGEHNSDEVITSSGTNPATVSGCINAGSVSATGTGGGAGAIVGNNNDATKSSDTSGASNPGTVENNFWPEELNLSAVGTGAGSSETDTADTVQNNSAYKEDGTLTETVTDENGNKLTTISEAVKELLNGDENADNIPDVLKATATFNNGDHGTAPTAQEVVIGTKITLPTMSNDGYWTFLNWTANDTTYNAGTEYTVTADVTFTANWRNDRPSTGGTTTYTVTAPSDVDNGSVTVSPKNASKGTTVTITVKPDDGYELDTLTVTNASGNKLTLTDKGDGKYTFTMPASKVTVEATFVEEETPITVPTFVDVPSDAYYADAVEWAVKNGITLGTSDTTFSPNLGCTRAQVVTFLWRAAGCPEPKGNSSSFTDVGNDLYYSKAVLWAVENGITLGTSDTTFSPDEICSRAQIVTFLWRNENRPGASTSNFFVDVTNSAYYADAVEWAAENEITLGTSATTFSPNDDCTRAQIVTFLYRTYAD